MLRSLLLRGLGPSRRFARGLTKQERENAGVVVGVYEDDSLTETGAEIDSETLGSLRATYRFLDGSGKPGKTLPVLLPAASSSSSRRVVLVGLGSKGRQAFLLTFFFFIYFYSLFLDRKSTR